MVCFLLFNILDHVCTTCFVFANSFGKSFQFFLQIVKGIWIRFREAFSRFWNFLPYFKCLSFDLNKTPLNEILLLAFKMVLIDINWKYIEMLILRIYQLKIIMPIWNISTKNFRKVVVRSFCFGLILSPPLALIAKNGDFVSPKNFLLHWYK